MSNSKEIKYVRRFQGLTGQDNRLCSFKWDSGNEEDSASKKLKGDDYKRMTEVLKASKERNKEVDLKLTLYIAACEGLCEGYKMSPFPPGFDWETGCGEQDVWTVNEAIPSVLLLKNYPTLSKLGRDAINVLHWIIVQLKEPKIHYVQKQDYSLVPLDLNQDQPKEIYRITYTYEESMKWKELAIDSKSRMGFYNGPLHEYHSLLHLGPEAINSREQQGVNLFDSISLCLSNSNRAWCWGKSLLAPRVTLVAVLEFIENHSAVSENGVWTLSDPNCCLLRYILVYKDEGNQPLPTNQFSLFQWFKRQFLIGCTLVLLSGALLNLFRAKFHFSSLY